jgi:hypothetical protein
LWKLHLYNQCCNAVLLVNVYTKDAKIFVISNKEVETVADVVFMKWICRYGCSTIKHTGREKEILNKIAAELYKKFDIKGIHTSSAHPQCNSQAEVFNETSAKYVKCVVDTSPFIWKGICLHLCSVTIHPTTELSKRLLANWFLEWNQDFHSYQYLNLQEKAIVKDLWQKDSNCWRKQDKKP